MKSVSRRLSLVASALLLAVAPAAAWAQGTGTVRGRITFATGGQGVAAAQVTINNTTLGAVTRDDGEYVITGVPAGRQVVIARRIGLTPERREVIVVSGQTVTADITLREAAVQLNEVVVTGTAAPTARRALGTSVASVDSTLLRRADAVSVDQALQGKVAGAQITQNSGNPGGGGITVRLRGTSSFIAGSDPLYLVDGVIVDNSSADLRGNLGVRGNVQNRLADINPADIERVEIIRGAAAAALYGSRANNGVVQIFTKRGRPGRTRLGLQTRYATSELRRRIGVNTYPFDASGLPVDRFDYQDQLFTTGNTGEANLSVEGGDERTTYYINGSWLKDDGILRSTSSDRRGARINLSQQLYPRLKVDLGANFVNTHNEFQVNGEGNGVITAFLFTPTNFNFFPVNGIYPLSPVSSANPLYAIDRFRNPQDVNRFVGSAHSRFQLLDNLAMDYTLGYDGYTLEQGEFIPRGAFAPPNSNANGLAANAVRGSRIINQDGVATLNTRTPGEIDLTTSVGFNYTTQQIRTTVARSNELLPIGELVTAGATFGAAQDLTELATLGFYGQQNVAWRDRLYLSGAIRWDASSTFGAEERWQMFPKLSASYVLSEEDWFRGLPGNNALSSLRLRAALGYAGNQPSVLNAYSRFSNYAPAGLDTRSGLVNSTILGNPGLKPERQREVEFGADLGLFHDRLSLEGTRYDKLVTDLLYFRPVAPTTGYSLQFASIGSMSNKGWELLARSVNVDRPKFNWTSTATYSRNRNRVESLSISDFQSASGYPNRVRAGEPIGIFYGAYAMRNCQTGAFLLDSIGRLRPSPTVPALPLDPAAQDTSQRRRLSGGTCNDSTNKILGDPNPDWLGSLLNEITFAKNLRFRVLLDGTFGNDVMNLTARIQDLGAALNSPETQAEFLPYGDPRRQGPGYYARRLSIFEQYVEDGSFVKLREVSVSYLLDMPWTRRVFSQGIDLTLSGRNLKVWTDYSGYDPELNLFGQNATTGTTGTVADRGFDFGGYPIPRTWSISARFVY
ncbi:MAG TPA: TonB-dependent receptor plug domain-containing protein [Gemmatimonadaceae bacterium]|nr:TonB-dependent receptor plug domain-containing protein [Gemmatimonadaceae bacterium]